MYLKSAIKFSIPILCLHAENFTPSLHYNRCMLTLPSLSQLKLKQLTKGLKQPNFFAFCIPKSLSNFTHCLLVSSIGYSGLSQGKKR